MIEKFTKEEREFMACLPPKQWRIWAKADALVSDQVHEIERLTKALGAAERTREALADQCARHLGVRADLREQALAAEAQVAELEAELEGDNGLRARNDAGWAIAKARVEKLNELHGIPAADTPEALEKLGGLLADKQLCIVKFSDVLDMNEQRSRLTAVPARTEAEALTDACRALKPAPKEGDTVDVGAAFRAVLPPAWSEAEQRVLNACATARIWTCYDGTFNYRLDDIRAICTAELARRGLRP